MPDPTPTSPCHPRGALEPTLGTRLHFAWSVFWVVVLTVFYTIGYLVTHLIRPTTSHFTWWAAAWGRAMMTFMGIRTSFEGAERVDPERPCVFVANHQNGLDIPVVANSLPVPFGFVAKAELEKVPLLGPSLKNSPSVFVDPSDPRRSLASIRAAGEEIRAGSSVLIFAEGARSYSGHLADFQKGAFLLALEAGVPIVPVTIVNGACVFDEKRRISRPGVIHTVIGEPIDLEGITRRELPALMQRVRDAIAAPLPAAWRNPPDALR